MEIYAFSLYFQEQLQNAYSYVLAYIEFILPQMISFHLSYSLSLCNENVFKCTYMLSIFIIYQTLFYCVFENMYL